MKLVRLAVFVLLAIPLAAQVDIPQPPQLTVEKLYTTIGDLYAKLQIQGQYIGELQTKLSVVQGELEKTKKELAEEKAKEK